MAAAGDDKMTVLVYGTGNQRGAASHTATGSAAKSGQQLGIL